MSTAHEAYVRHTEECPDCHSVDVGRRRFRRCALGQELVRAAAKIYTERAKKAFLRKKSGKPFLTAQDFILMRDLKIKL